ncbi:hypothetical protein QFZ75_006806 [Streptomyces sp. V3I8]|uniref:hypothetical protein n=1 Tax=Streptomyces sp. V3I8 TaxID=3042279 RepID=UPI0027866B5F|nr:hypothetical protein [Streptomyces sp. V3I8]MDQ1040390.1 hypothetical protein [Streptomyces sp. V3I8]
MKAFALALVGRTAEAVTWAEHAHAGHRQVDERALVSHPAVQRVPLVLALSEAARPAEARREGERAYAEPVAADSVVRVWMAAFLGRAEWLAGLPATARRWWAEAAALARTFDHVMALRLALGGLTACAAVLGDMDAVGTSLAEHRTLPPQAPGLLSAGEERLGEAWLMAARRHLGSRRPSAVMTEPQPAAVPPRTPSTRQHRPSARPTGSSPAPCRWCTAMGTIDDTPHRAQTRPTAALAVTSRRPVRSAPRPRPRTSRCTGTRNTARHHRL